MLTNSMEIYYKYYIFSRNKNYKIKESCVTVDKQQLFNHWTVNSENKYNLINRDFGSGYRHSCCTKMNTKNWSFVRALWGTTSSGHAVLHAILKRTLYCAGISAKLKEDIDILAISKIMKESAENT